MNRRLAQAINILGRFCGKRDIPELSHRCLQAFLGQAQVDVMVLFGASILCGGDLMAQAMEEGIAKTYLIVGGAGHTTETLRQLVHREYPQIETAEEPEAVVFQRYLQTVYGCEADYLETRSTNCGNNITNLLALLEEKQIPHSSILLCQDATMQCRMDAGLRKYAPQVRIVNYAAYAATVVPSGAGLSIQGRIHGMWDLERYVHLLMGEIPRLSDTETGYGPRGKGFIAHVEIPEEVHTAFLLLQQYYGTEVREANPLYASK